MSAVKSSPVDFRFAQSIFFWGGGEIIISFQNGLGAGEIVNNFFLTSRKSVEAFNKFRFGVVENHGKI
jgi:hypothetical protein